MMSENPGIFDCEKIGKREVVGLNDDGERWKPWRLARSGWWHRNPDKVQLLKKGPIECGATQFAQKYPLFHHEAVRLAEFGGHPVTPYFVNDGAMEASPKYSEIVFPE